MTTILRRSLLLLSLCLPLLAGDKEIDEFNAAYWAAQHPAVRSLLKIDDSVVRENAATGLAFQGYQIDKCIMVWNWSPWHTMFYRMVYGYTWIPSMLQMPVMRGPGIEMPGSLPPYDPSRPPPGSIVVSLNLKDYPPYKVVPVPTLLSLAH